MVHKRESNAVIPVIYRTMSLKSGFDAIETMLISRKWSTDRSIEVTMSCYALQRRWIMRSPFKISSQRGTCKLRHMDLGEMLSDRRKAYDREMSIKITVAVDHYDSIFRDDVADLVHDCHQTFITHVSEPHSYLWVSAFIKDGGERLSAWYSNRQAMWISDVYNSLLSENCFMNFIAQSTNSSRWIDRHNGWDRHAFELAALIVEHGHRSIMG